MQSKEEQVLEPFFNNLKYWHFDELRSRIAISKPQLSVWLKRYEKEGLIQRIKPKGKMPYYAANVDSAEYKNQKKLFGLKILTNSGLLTHITTLKDAKVAVLFGSFSRSDWYEHSDIDIFIYGSDKNFEHTKYELKLKRNIEIHSVKDQKDLKRIDKMLPYIVSGNFIKGSIEDLGVQVYAKI